MYRNSFSLSECLCNIFMAVFFAVFMSFIDLFMIEISMIYNNEIKILGIAFAVVAEIGILYSTGLIIKESIRDYKYFNED